MAGSRQSSQLFRPNQERPTNPSTHPRLLGLQLGLLTAILQHELVVPGPSLLLAGMRAPARNEILKPEKRATKNEKGEQLSGEVLGVDSRCCLGAQTPFTWRSCPHFLVGRPTCRPAGGLKLEGLSPCPFFSPPSFFPKPAGRFFPGFRRRCSRKIWIGKWKWTWKVPDPGPPVLRSQALGFSDPGIHPQVPIGTRDFEPWRASEG